MSGDNDFVKKLKEYAYSIFFFLVFGPILLVWFAGFIFGPAVERMLPDWFGAWFMVALGIIFVMAIFHWLKPQKARDEKSDK